MRILHTMLRVGDLDRSIAFYTQVLGMKLLSRQDYPEGKFTLAFVGFDERVDGRQVGDAEIELTHNWGVESYEIGTGYGHIAITTDDIDTTLALLAEQGIEPEKPPYTIREGGSRLCFVKDPDGYRVELLEMSA